MCAQPGISTARARGAPETITHEPYTFTGTADVIWDPAVLLWIAEHFPGFVYRAWVGKKTCKGRICALFPVYLWRGVDEALRRGL